MLMTDAELDEMDRLLELLEDASNSLQELYRNIDNYDRHTASAKIGMNAGIVKGVVLTLSRMKG